MKNFIQVGDVVTCTAPAGGVTSGGIYKIGKLAVVAAFSAAAGAEFEGHTTGVFELPKDAADVLAAGDVANIAAGVVDAEGTDAVGIVLEAAGNGDTTCIVKLVQTLA